MGLRAEHARATRAAVLQSARALFAQRGYSATSLDQIAGAARVTKGAVYHHFQGKRAVFSAVYELLSSELEAELRARAESTPPTERLRSTVGLLLTKADDPQVRNILFRDGPSVLGGECRAIDRRHYLGLLEAQLRALIDAGVLKPAPLEVLSRLLLAVLVEGSGMLGDAENIDEARASLREALGLLMSGLMR